jgi:hypothetical protein
LHYCVPIACLMFEGADFCL